MIKNKFNGYSGDGRRLYPGGGGPSSTTSYQTNIPEYAKPYVETMLGTTMRQLFTGGEGTSGGTFAPTGFREYMPFGATYQKDAQGNPVRDAQGRVIYTNTAQQQAQAAVAGLTPLQQQAISGIGAYTQPGQTEAASSMAAEYSRGAVGAGYYNPLAAERFQIGKPMDVRTDSFTAPYVSQGYMSPYMQNVVNTQQREARRAADIQRMQNQAQAVGAGAYGGSRQAIVEAERQRNLGTQLGDIQAQGLQQAYQQGMGQFNAEQQAYLTAQQANQQARLQAAIQNLGAQQATQQLQEQSRQFGGGLGLQGYGTGIQGAGLLGQMGAQQFQQEMATLQAQLQAGGVEQQQQQQVINQAIQNYATQQQYPFLQLGIMSNMLRGLPMQAGTTSMYQAQPMGVQQLVGTAGALYNMGKGGAFKEGGVVKMAKGGIASGLSSYELEPMAKRLADDQLQMKLQDPQTDMETKGIMQAEADRRAYARSNMAGGGAIAFKEGNKVDEIDRKDTEWGKAEEAERTREAGKKPPKSGAAPSPKPVKGQTATEVATKGDPNVDKYMGIMAPSIAEAQKITSAEEALAKVGQEQAPSLTESVQELREARKAAGADPAMFERMRGEKKSLLDEAVSDAEKQKYLRQAQAWATFASTPGPLLVAGMKAVMKLAEETIEDDKELRKVKTDIMKSIHEIDMADYNESMGLADKAITNRKDAYTRALSANERLVQAQQQRSQTVMGGVREAVQAGAGLTREQEKSRADIIQEKIRASAKGTGGEEKSIQAQTRAARAELQKWDNSEEGKSLAQAESMLANPELKGKAREKFAADRDRLKTKRDALQREVMDSYPNARLQEPTTTPAGGGATYNYVPGKGLVPAK